MAGEQDATKRAILERLLDQGMVLVTMDARADGVCVPSDLLTDAQLRLNLSLRFGRPMECTDEGVEATLTFRGNAFDCFLPWGSIYMLISHTTGQPFLFPADVPDEAEGPGDVTAGEENSDGPRLTVVSSPPSPGPQESDPEPPPDHPPSRGHLRVVK